MPTRRARHGPRPGMIDLLARADRRAERHRRWIAGASAIAFWLVCADYARFIDLPNIVTVPVMVTGILTGMRYALWEGWLQPKVKARAQEKPDEQ